jgi:hypothetical protein
MTRLYLPATLALLAELDHGSVLETSEAFVAADETEEAEYAALVAATEASGALLPGVEGALADGLRRRVVVVVEVAGEPDVIGIGDVVAVHADPADLGGQGAVQDDDLGWYATQEIPDLLRGN